jgi:hypothetical protein
MQIVITTMVKALLASLRSGPALLSASERKDSKREVHQLPELVTPPYFTIKKAFPVVRLIKLVVFLILVKKHLIPSLPTQT